MISFYSNRTLTNTAHVCIHICLCMTMSTGASEEDISLSGAGVGAFVNCLMQMLQTNLTSSLEKQQMFFH